MEGNVLIYVALILAASAFVQSATGFGLALVSVSLLPLVMPVEEGIALVAMFNVFVTIGVMLFNRSGVEFRLALPLIIGMVLGIPIGYFGLRAMDSEWIIRTLGLILILIALLELLSSRFRKLSLPKKTAVPIGFVGGILGGAFNVGGPPIVIYTYSQDWPKVQAVVILQSAFLVGGLTRNGLMMASGEYTLDLLRLIGLAAIPAILAIWLGKKTLDRFPQQVLKKVVFVMILVIGLRYLIIG